MSGTVRSRHGSGENPYERTALTVELGSEDHRRLYHLHRDQARDFDLVDGQGQPVVVQVAGARLIGPVITEHECDPKAVRRFEPACWPPPLTRLWSNMRRLTMGSYHLCDGDRVEVYGTKDRVVDRMMSGRLARQDPLQHALRSSEMAPLVIVTR